MVTISNEILNSRFKRDRDYLFEENKKVRQDNEKKGQLIVNTLFTDELMEYIVFKLLSFESDRNIDNIMLYINSHGGEVHSLLPIVDAIDASRKPVATVCLGYAYSAAAMLLMSGTKGYRFAMKNSRILIHEVSMYFDYQKNTQIQIDAEELKTLNEKLVEIIKSKTKMKDRDIKRYMNSNIDECMSAEQALHFGIIDKII